MTAALVLLAVALAGVVAYLAMRSGGDGESAEWLLIRRDMPAAEAHVAVGFLQAQGIAAGIRPSTRGLAAKGPPASFDVYADPARAVDARVLLDDV